MRRIPWPVLGPLEVQVNLPAFGNSDIEPIAPRGPVAAEKHVGCPLMTQSGHRRGVFGLGALPLRPTMQLF